MKKLDNPRYDPASLLDCMIDRLKLKNDAALARVLAVAPPVVSKMRNRKLAIGDTLLLRLHDASGMPVNDLRLIMGVPAVPLAVVRG